MFDDVRLFDKHRRRCGCLDPGELGLARIDGVWRMQPEQPVPRPRVPRARSQRPAAAGVAARPAR
ncbi:MAG TPA: hypothetical protein VFE65_33970 [Pseudonocardia sp.]|nr:hypothetical protein [Pseudonocardia sp.]